MTAVSRAAVKNNRRLKSPKARKKTQHQSAAVSGHTTTKNAPKPLY